MKRVLLFLAVSLLLASLSGAAFSQELVIFTNDTAMSVKSHSEKGGYIYLTLQEGQIAVPRERVKEIKRSNAPKGASSAQYTPAVSNPEPAREEDGGRANGASREGFRKPMGRPHGLRAPSSGDDEDEMDDEDDESGDPSADDDEDDEEEAPSASPKEPVEPRPARPMVPEKFGKPVASNPAGRKR